MQYIHIILDFMKDLLSSTLSVVVAQLGNQLKMILLDAKQYYKKQYKMFVQSGVVTEIQCMASMYAILVISKVFIDQINTRTNTILNTPTPAAPTTSRVNTRTTLLATYSTHEV